jgi:outer membrane protein
MSIVRSCAAGDLRISHLWAVALLLLAPFTAAADPSFDPFRTGAALSARTPGLTDPLGRECSQQSGALTLPTAVDLALCRNPATRTAWANARANAAQLGSAESAWLPSVSASGAIDRLNGARVDVLGQPTSGPQTTRDAALNLSWTLYDFGARSGRIAAARHLLDAAAANTNSVVQQTVFKVIQAYYGVVAADADLVAARTTEGAATRSLEVARGRREGGVATLADVLQAETAANSAALARVQAQATAKNARGALAVAIGSDADEGYVLEPEPVPAQVPALTARMTDLMNEAVRQRPELAAAQAQRDAAQANVTVARAAGRPTISVGAGRTYDEISGGVPNQSYNTIGVQVTVPIFTGFNVTYGVHQAQAQLEAADAGVDQARLGVTLDVWNGYYGLISANEQLTVTAALIKSAADNEQVAIGRYQSGVGTIIDLLTAQTAAATARQQRVAAEFGWQVARAQLALALGRLTGLQPLAAMGSFP